MARRVSASGTSACLSQLRRGDSLTVGMTQWTGSCSLPHNYAPGRNFLLVLDRVANRWEDIGPVFSDEVSGTADALAQAIIQKGDLGDHGDLAESYLLSTNPRRWDRLRQIPDWHAVDAASEHRLRSQLEQMAVEHPEARELLRRLTRR